MRVGILTFHSSYNFGANLQTLAVQELFRSKGCQPIVIDYRDPRKTEMLRARVSPAQAQRHEQFVEKYLHTSPRFHHEREVQEYCRDALDVIAVGSDQVFRLGSPWAPQSLWRALRAGTSSSSRRHSRNDLPVYFLPWPKNGSAGPVRVTVAACATGTSCFVLGTTRRAAVRRALRAFDFVSVRDDWTGIVVRWLSGGGRTVAHCPDPVFGLNDFFRVPAEEIPDLDISKTILVSAAFGQDWRARFRDLAHEQGFTVSNLPDPDRLFACAESDFTINLPLSPLAWYRLLAGSAGYVGARFHGLVSCAANGTPAVSLAWSNRPRLLKIACRKYDLCRRAGAPKRYVPVNWLRHPSPDLVLRRLLDGTSQLAVNRYAEQARRRLGDVLDTILSQVCLRRGM